MSECAEKEISYAVLRTGIVFTHFFYIPIILASLWWKRKGLIVIIYLAALLVLSDVFFKMPSYDDLPWIFMFIVIGSLVAELHGGRMWAESKYGEGSTFTYLLPVEAKKKGET